jgi:glucokinase
MGNAIAERAGQDLVIGVDLGGTKLAAGLVDGDGHVVAQARWSRPLRAYEQALDAIEALAGEMRENAADRGARVVAAGVAAAGLFDVDRTTVLYAPILEWRNRPFLADLTQRLDLPVVVDNDANAAAWGEYRHGAGAGERCLVLVTLGTGVGGGVVIDGRLLSGGSGIAAELGHLKVGSEGRACPCGREDCLEQYASGVALGRSGQVAAARDPALGRRLLALAAGDPDRIDGRLVTTAAHAGDPLALRLLDEAGTWLGRGLAQVASVLDPSLILVGGGLALADELVLAPARTAYMASVSLRPVRTLAPIRAAALGNAAGVIGIAALARSARPDPRQRADRTLTSPVPRLTSL